MADYYCHSCAVSESIVVPEIPQNLSGSDYQLDKFLKHTAPSTVYPGVNSIFDNPTYDSYKDFIVTTLASGSVQIDDYGRTNMVWYAGSGIGATYEDGAFTTHTDSVKVVLHDDELKIHAFPTASNVLESKTCLSCGKEIPI